MPKPTEADDRVPLARAYAQVSIGISVVVEMVLPGIVGHVVDRWLGTRVLFTLIGFMLGLGYGVWELVALGRQIVQGDDRHEQSGSPPSDAHPSDRFDH